MTQTRDILAELGPLALGSRLKRLTERLQADALVVHKAFGYPTQPSHFPLLAALERYGPLYVNEAAEALGVAQPGITRMTAALTKLGLIAMKACDQDLRTKCITLTPEGAAMVADMRVRMWPVVEGAARTLIAQSGTDILEAITGMEDAIAQTSHYDRIMAEAKRQGLALSAPNMRTMPMTGFEIVPFRDELAQDFYDINAPWVEEMFSLEPKDKEQLGDPKTHILDKGGKIFFVKDPELGLVGAAALNPHEPGRFELTKMGVKKEARGRKAGEFLLTAIIAEAKAMGVKDLFLLTNSKCEAAIHLYKKAGFYDDAEVLAEKGVIFRRCDVAMRYPL
ncbi:bifunctional helix-turn-helix transcriptional regulator/GNAT family N-acetyltransferase [Woodsholea maritima]|uniref:bifunctional helix-turn-helix transcriptional regulator/GNAT family N-acetyltransferase n=1 Tax=Woodsholea maritima TaxID=240237 RepID=UPI0003646E8C|nr:bifunctional helix-turn-helix transcriptional regulator/GNAT family N-acetyltransferase [Woodsholea maritima]